MTRQRHEKLFDLLETGQKSFPGKYGIQTTKSSSQVITKDLDRAA